MALGWARAAHSPSYTNSGRRSQPGTCPPRGRRAGRRPAATLLLWLLLNCDSPSHAPSSPAEAPSGSSSPLSSASSTLASLPWCSRRLSRCRAPSPAGDSRPGPSSSSESESLEAP